VNLWLSSGTLHPAAAYTAAKVSPPLLFRSGENSLFLSAHLIELEKLFRVDLLLQ
jgi:hypothetical protein